MSYKPKYWTDSVELVKNFDTTVSLLEPIVITKAFIKEDIFEVEYILANDTLEDQVNLILLSFVISYNFFILYKLFKNFMFICF